MIAESEPRIGDVFLDATTIARRVEQLGAEISLDYAGDTPPTPERSLRPYLQRWPPAEQVFHPAALPDPADRDEAEAVLRRVGVRPLVQGVALWLLVSVATLAALVTGVIPPL